MADKLLSFRVTIYLNKSIRDFSPHFRECNDEYTQFVCLSFVRALVTLVVVRVPHTGCANNTVFIVVNWKAILNSPLQIPLSEWVRFGQRIKNHKHKKVSAKIAWFICHLPSQYFYGSILIDVIWYLGTVRLKSRIQKV